MYINKRNADVLPDRFAERIKDLAQGHDGALTIMTKVVKSAGSCFIIHSSDGRDTADASVELLLDYLQVLALTGQDIFDMYNYCSDSKVTEMTNLLKAVRARRGLSKADLFQIISDRRRIPPEIIRKAQTEFIRVF